MEIQAALKNQYHAALAALRLAVERCPDAFWSDRTGGCAPFWRVAYHTLFFTHLYLQQDMSRFKPWAHHVDHIEDLGNKTAVARPAPGEPARPDGAYTRAEILEYWQVCDTMIDAGVDALDLSAPQCGFPWYKMPTLEHQLVNIRHVQHHAAALSTRLLASAGIAVDWVGRAKVR